MTMPDDARAELPRDEHLLAALRHAPDHALTPPSHVTQAILAAAEQVHRAPAPAVAAPAPVRPLPERHVSLAERLQALLAPRWAGSVAAGLVAALVVGLWYEEDLPAPVNHERVAAQTQSEPGRSAPARPAAPPAATAPPEPAQAPRTPTPTPTPAAAAAAKATGGAEARRKAVTAPREDAATAVAERTQAAPPVAPRVATTAPATMPTAPASPAPLTAPQSEAPSAPAPPAAAAREARAPAESPPAPRADAAAPMLADALRRAESAKAAPSTGAEAARDAAAAVGAMRLAPGPAAGVAAASPALTLLRRARADAEAHSAIWTWQTASAATARSFDIEAQEWLQRVVYAARGRWVDVAERSDGGAAADVRWWRNDEPVATLRIEAQGLRWAEPSGRIRYASMTADELARLSPP